MTPPKRAANLQTEGLTLKGYAEHKKLPIDFLRRLGLRECRYRGTTAIRIPYADQLGRVTCTRIRLAMTGQRFAWSTGSKLSPYGTDRLEDARDLNHITLVEGESDTQTLWYHQQPALGLPGAASWRPEWDNLLANIGTIYIVIEPDRGGEALLAKMMKSGLVDRLHIVRLGRDKDVSALHCHDPSGFLLAWDLAKKNSVSVSAEQKAKKQAQAKEDEKLCHALANSADILSLVAESIGQGGFVGEAQNVKIIYLAVTSRVLPKPVSIVVKGPSSAGKSAVLEEVLRYFPEDAFYALSTMTERALIYSEECLVHRMLVIYEASGMAGELASYLIRSLLSEGRIRYETVEKTSEGMKPRLIERQGPTGLIVTTTAISLHPENETRLFSLLATDSPEQTAAIMAATAKRHAGSPANSANFEAWHALQRWLARRDLAVAVPFAGAIAAGIHPVAVRLRRDFSALIHLIQTHAVLHQATRRRDQNGRIIAELKDYAAIFELIDPLLAEGSGVSISQTMRETVQAVASIAAAQGSASVTDVAQALSLDTSSASRRIHAALKKGFLENEEQQPRRKARLVLGIPLPEARGMLPPPQSLQVCSSERGDK